MAAAWAALVLGAAGAIGAGVSRTTPASPAYPLAVTWGLIAVAVRDQREHPVVAAAALTAAALTTIAALIGQRPRLRRRGRAG